MFVTNEANIVGIYAFTFTIRGKPWIVEIDDKMIFKKTGAGATATYALLYAKPGTSVHLYTKKEGNCKRYADDR